MCSTLQQNEHQLQYLMVSKWLERLTEDFFLLGIDGSIVSGVVSCKLLLRQPLVLIDFAYLPTYNYGVGACVHHSHAEAEYKFVVLQTLDATLWPCLFELQEADSALLVKLNLGSRTNNYCESALPVKSVLLVKLDLQSETNNHFESAFPVKLNLDSGHF